MGSVITLYDAKPGKEVTLAKVFATQGRAFNLSETIFQEYAIHEYLHDEIVEPSPHIHFAWPYNDNSLEADLPGLLDLIKDNQSNKTPLFSQREIALIKQEYEKYQNTISLKKTREAIQTLCLHYPETSPDAKEGDIVPIRECLGDLFSNLDTLLKRVEKNSKYLLYSKNIWNCIEDIDKYIEQFKGSFDAVDKLEADKLKTAFTRIKSDLVALKKFRATLSGNWYPGTSKISAGGLLVADVTVAVISFPVTLFTHLLRGRLFHPFSDYYQDNAKRVTPHVKERDIIQPKETQPLLHTPARLIKTFPQATSSTQPDSGLDFSPTTQKTTSLAPPATVATHAVTPELTINSGIRPQMV